ncbi:vesicle transport protein SFT2A isoform X8 [Aquarana catesbeiana]|uniref:vesicle transport protein SFT2A isoform X8 n=1 Tax=Aquarana catesbeiana TaxID=8400 RepID=UPI003CC9ABCB
MDKLRRVLNGHEDEERGLTTQDCHQLQKGFGFNIAKFWHTCEVVCSILYIGNCIFNSRECTTVGSWCWNKTFCCILYTRKCCCLNQLCLICTLCAVFWWQKKGLAFLFCILQFLAMTWYSISYIPFASDPSRRAHEQKRTNTDAIIKCFSSCLN